MFMKPRSAHLFLTAAYVHIWTQRVSLKDSELGPHSQDLEEACSVLLNLARSVPLITEISNDEMKRATTTMRILCLGLPAMFAPRRKVHCKGSEVLGIDNLRRKD